MPVVFARRPSSAGLRQMRAGRLRLRLGHRIAAGLTPERAAQAEGLGPERLDAILADPAFGALVESCRRLRELPEAERLARLEELAWLALERAVQVERLSAVLFVLTECRAGRNPARTLAEGVVRADRRAAARLTAEADPAPAEPAPPRPAGPRPPADPLAASVARGAARLRAAIRAEHALHHGAAPLPAPTGGRPAGLAAAAEAPATPPAEAKAPAVPPKLNRHQRRRRAALARKRAAASAAPSAARPAHPSRPQGP